METSNVQCVRLVRSWNYKNSQRGYWVFIDGAKVGVINNGEIVECLVNAGHHSVTLKIDWCKSNTIKVVVGKGQTAVLEVCMRGLKDWQTWITWGGVVTLFGMGALTGNLIGWVIFGGCGALIAAAVVSTPYLILKSS